MDVLPGAKVFLYKGNFPKCIFDLMLTLPWKFSFLPGLLMQQNTTRLLERFSLWSIISFQLYLLGKKQLSCIYISLKNISHFTCASRLWSQPGSAIRQSNQCGCVGPLAWEGLTPFDFSWIAELLLAPIKKKKKLKLQCLWVLISCRDKKMALLWAQVLRGRSTVRLHQSCWT